MLTNTRALQPAPPPLLSPPSVPPHRHRVLVLHHQPQQLLQALQAGGHLEGVVARDVQKLGRKRKGLQYGVTRRPYDVHGEKEREIAAGGREGGPVAWRREQTPGRLGA